MLHTRTHLVEEHLGLPQDMLELSQLKEVPLEGFGVLVHLTELVLELFEGGLCTRVNSQYYSKQYLTFESTSEWAFERLYRINRSLLFEDQSFMHLQHFRSVILACSILPLLFVRKSIQTFAFINDFTSLDIATSFIT